MRGLASIALLLALASTGCEFARPTVAVTHGLGEGRQVANLRFSGCVWTIPLTEGETTSPRECLPGELPIFYDLLDDAQPELGWQGRKTIRPRRVDYGDEAVFTLTLDDDERDTDAPGPYGH